VSTRLGPSDGRDSFAFGEKLLNLLDEGAFATTYKYALLLALIDVCMEKTGSHGQAPEAISTRELAAKTLEIYWPQAAPFVLSKGASILKQSGKGQAEIVSAIRKFRERHAPDPSAPLFRARTEAPDRYEERSRARDGEAFGADSARLR
jgi:hypothetical protein